MKKLFFVVSMMLMSVATFAQQGTCTAGAHASFLLEVRAHARSFFLKPLGRE